MTDFPPPEARRARPFHYLDGQLCCEDLSLQDAAETFGTPLYVNSADAIRHRLDLFLNAFRALPHTVCFAVKASSTLAILALLGERGAGFDIVSGGELERVSRACPEALTRVVFSGVGKQVWEIDAAIRANILLFNVESAAEIDLLASRAAAMGTRARFALRVNPDVSAETHPYISTGLREHKFGVEIERARSIYRLAAQHASLEAAGVSVHIGSQIRSMDPFARALDRITELAEELRSDGHAIRYLDIGGGLGIDYGAEAGFDPHREIESYAAALRGRLNKSGVHLLLEPGRFLVAQAGGLLTRVLHVKQNGSKTFVITDAGMNDLIRPALYQAHHEILPVAEARGGVAMEVVDVVGPVCESGDFFARDRRLPPVGGGDLVLLLDAGAYGLSLASNYNTRARPAEILVERGQASLIRRRETMDDILATELVPVRPQAAANP